MAEPVPGPGLDDDAVEQRLARLDDVLGQLEQIPGRTAGLAMEAVEALIEMYGEAIRRIVANAANSAEILDRLICDELLCHLLLLHGAHPDPLPVRVAQAVNDLHPRLRSQGASVRLTDIRDGVAYLIVSSGSCGTCGSTAALHELVREQVLTMAPELAGVDVTSTVASTLIPVTALSRRPVQTRTPGGPE